LSGKKPKAILKTMLFKSLMENSFRQNRLHPEKAAAWTRVFSFSAFVSLFLLLTAGCVQQPLPEAGSAPALLYTSKCGLCHAPYHPQAHTYTGWKKVVTRMEKNAEAKGMDQLLSEEEKASIFAYLEKNGRKGF